MFDSFLKTIVHHGYTLIGCVIEVANSFECRDKTSTISAFRFFKFGRYLVKNLLPGYPLPSTKRGGSLSPLWRPVYPFRVVRDNGSRLIVLWEKLFVGMATRRLVLFHTLIGGLCEVEP